MQSKQQQLLDIMQMADGGTSTMSLDDIKALVERYPYYQLARLALMKLLFNQHDASYTEELRRAALYLPSRETLYQVTEGDSLRPHAENVTSGLTGGATVAHKTESRTVSLIDTFLSGVSSQPQHTPRADASTDYISYMLQEQEENASEDIPTSNSVEVQSSDTASVSSSMQTIDTFLRNNSERRIRLRDKDDSELQKPVLESENGAPKSAFTETLAQIYIKQGKFEQAIEIIRRLYLKNPEKNRYFADQIRFLEKLVINQKASKA